MTDKTYFRDNNNGRAVSLIAANRFPAKWQVTLWCVASVVSCCCIGPLMCQARYTPENTGTADGLIDRVNPNIASAFSLARLPGIGPVRAEAIVEYRRQHRQACGPDTAPFTHSTDMCNVKGIGRITVSQISQYLAFDGNTGK